ncbi:hypothetical protein HYT25_02740 [Candidatus Pacearchaeota archaeon]|nr:hypothetical protein [Candidatus Pacearchaeota archaeon]
MKNEFDEEIDLTREEIDGLEETTESLRNYGKFHFNFDKKDIIINCRGLQI